MTETIQNILYIAAAGAALLVGVFVLRGVFKTVWKIARVALVLFAILMIAGYFLGYVNINLP
jgi:energy-coupling factor transporter transmembrane protein EcfT